MILMNIIPPVVKKFKVPYNDFREFIFPEKCILYIKCIVHKIIKIYLYYNSKKKINK
jgi:hypothetical protein